mgnify:FL=1
MTLDIYNSFPTAYQNDVTSQLETTQELVERMTTRRSPLFSTNTATQKDVTFGETLSAQLGYAYMPLQDAIANATNFGEEDRDQNYNPFDDMENFEQYQDYLKDAVNSDHMLQLKRQLMANEKRREILANSSFGSQLVAGLFDPINLIALPFGGFALGALRSAVRTGAGVAVIQAGQEAGRYPFDPLGTEKEVAANIGMAFIGGAALGGVVGGIVGRRQNKALRQLEKDANDLNNLAEDVNVIRKVEDEIEPHKFSDSVTEKTLREQEEFIGPPKPETLPPLERTLDDPERPFVKARKDILQREQQQLPASNRRLEEEIDKLENDPDVISIPFGGVKKLKNEITKIDYEIKRQTKILPQELIVANKNLEQKIQKITNFIDKIKGGRDKYAAQLNKIKDDLIAQSEGKRGLTVGLTKGQQDFLNKIKAREKEDFLTPSQKRTLDKNVKEATEAQARVDANKRLLETKRIGNEKFLGEKGLTELRKRKQNIELKISKLNLLRANADQLRENNILRQEIEQELSIRRTEEMSEVTGGYSIKDPFKLPDNWYTDSFVYRALVTPLKKAFQSDIPITVKDAFSKLANDAGLTQVAAKYGKSLGMSVYTKSSVRNGEYVQAHDKLRKLYAEHTGKDQVYLDVDFQKKGYHEWLETTYTKILKQDQPLTDLDKQVKGIVDDFMINWELRLQEQGMIGNVKSLEKEITRANLRLLNYIKKLRKVVGGRGDDLQNANADILLKDAESVLRGVRQQKQYKNIKDLTLEEIQERFAQDYNIKQFITDQKTVDDFFLKYKGITDVKKLPLGTHFYRTIGSKGSVFINERGIRDRWDIIQRAQKNPEGFQKYINEEAAVFEPDGTIVKKVRAETEAGMHLKYEVDNAKFFESYDDFYDFVVYHEFSHGKFAKRTDEDIVGYEYRTNDLALERFLQEKETFNLETQGLVLSRKSMKDLDSLQNLKMEGSLSKNAAKYKNKTLIPEIKKINDELTMLHKNLNEAKTSKVAPNEEEFFFPRYWDLEKIRDNRAGLEQVLTEWYTNNPTLFVKQKDGSYSREKPLTSNDMMLATDPARIKKRVNDTIDNILNERKDITDDSMAFYGYGKSKHTRHRTLDIPNKLVTDFIISNPVQVMRVYTQRVAPKYEFSKQYGGRSIDQVVADIETDLYAAGKSERQVNETRRDFLHLYDRIVGRVLTNPDRWDQRAAIVLRDLAQLNYLGSAGFSTIPDFAKIVMEHELGNVMKGLVGILQDSRVRLTAKEGRLAGEILEILQGDTHMRLVEDLTNSPIDKNAYQRNMSKVRNVFYLLNGLAPMTNMMKKLDATIRQHEMIEFSIKDAQGLATKKEIEYLRRYNIDKKISADIKKLFDDGVIQNTKEGGKGVYLANTEKWLESGIAEETLDTFRGSLNSGIMNTILMGTPADKPIIADGIVYIPQWIGKRFGLKEDARYKGYTRVETGLAGLPFQFWSYSFAAANKITAAMATGQAKNRTAAAVLALGLGYTSLEIKSQFGSTAVQAMWDNMPIEDKLARSFDASGLAAMYSDVFYTAMNTSMALGGPDISMGLLQPKFPQEKNIVDAFTAVGGAGPSIGVDLFGGLKQVFYDGEYGAGSKQILKNLPYMRLWFIKEYVNEMGKVLEDVDEEGFERVMRTRF